MKLQLRKEKHTPSKESTPISSGGSTPPTSIPILTDDLLGKENSNDPFILAIGQSPILQKVCYIVLILSLCNLSSRMT